MPMMWGNMHLSNNGQNHMNFKLHIELTETVDGSIQRYLNKFPITENLKYFTACSEEIGHWNAGLPSSFVFNSGMQDKISFWKSKSSFKVVTVLQAPFMMWNENTSNFQFWERFSYC